MTTNHLKTLTDAQNELRRLVSKWELRKRKAHLENVIFGIKLALGNQGEAPRTLSDSIRLVLRATEQFLSNKEVLDRVIRCHNNVNIRSVRTILSRMVLRGQALRGKTPTRRIGFKCSPSAPPKVPGGWPFGRKRFSRGLK